jgi:hypothetical protein
LSRGSAGLVRPADAVLGSFRAEALRGTDRQTLRVRVRAHTLAAVVVVIVAGSAPAGATSLGIGALPPGTAFTAFAGSVVTQPQPVRATDGYFHLAYELVLTNTRPVTVKLGRIEVRDARTKRLLLSLAGSALAANTTPLGGPAVDEGLRESSRPGTSVHASGASIVWLDVRVRRWTDVPRELAHRVSASAQPPRGKRVTFTDFLEPVSTLRRPAVVLGPPLRGGPWLVSDSCCVNDTHHRRGVAAINGALQVPQRFAIDWFLLDARHRTWIGDTKDVHSYLSFGPPVIASAAGTVVEVQDGLPDQQPPEPPVPPPIPNTVGNHVTLKIARGLYLLYAHMTPGSVRVRMGQHVRRGQVLGLIGTSGNSTTPHLHFQVMTTPTFFPTDSPPFAFDRFDLVGQVTKRIWDDDIGLQPTPFLPYRAVLGGLRRREMPLDRNVVVFPEA